jgi:bifunctional DNA-binding transcriptional regulator/antitoxin component of YhaV-PrlF toxin-antitoxin module
MLDSLFGFARAIDRVDTGTGLALPLPSLEIVKHRRRGRTRISSKNQATLPVDALRAAGLKPGDELVVQAAGSGRIVLVRAADLIDGHAGKAPGVYAPDALHDLRSEWR